MAEKCNECGEMVDPLLVTAAISEWDADDEQVDEMGEQYEHLKGDWISTDECVHVYAHICPECKSFIGEPGIEQV